jgi:hypothetical protein
MSQTLEESKVLYKNGYYQQKLEEGMQFQDIVSRELYQRGIIVLNYSSRKYQQKYGENMLGAEIKLDKNFRKTGNFYIETAEKSHPDKDAYCIAGIMRGDNSWLFVIGDEQTIYIFPTNYLRKLSKNYRYVSTPTSKGYLFPVSDAERYCIRKIEIITGK